MTKVCSLFLSLFISLVQAEQDTSSQSRLVIGFYYPPLSNVSSQADIEISLNYWMKELTDKIDIKNSYSVIYDDIVSMKTAFDNRKIDMVIAPPLLLAIHFERNLLSDGFVCVKEKNKKDHLVIITNQKQKIATTSFLGKRLLLPTNDLLAELFIQTETLKHYQHSYPRVFSQISKVNSNQRIILDLFFGRADVAVVYQSTLNLMAEMNPQITKKITVLNSFAIKSRNYGYFHRDYHYQVQLKKLTHQFTSEIRGRQILEVFQSSDIETLYVDDLTKFDTFYKSYLKLKKTLVND
ncbi:MAG: PhnD/SsuA/transferrin family substrate-binding protein [Methylococcaceae bacterium]|nr:PhnD/SsuA/transferrin family substrate-binding protein [Methylococcaceae bacterium]